MLIKYLKTIGLSFYASSIYIDALRNWRGHGLTYLFIVTTLCSTFTISGFMLALGTLNPTSTADYLMDLIVSRPNLSFEENINRFINLAHQIPEITIENGIATTTSPQPYTITDPISGEDIAIIDTTGESKSLSDTSAVILLTNSKLIIKNSQDKDDIIYLRDLERHYRIDEYSLNEALFILAQIPNLRIQSGQFVTESNQLYKIFDHDNIEIAQIGPNASLNETLSPMLAISPLEINYKTILNKNGSTILASDFNEPMLFELLQNFITIIKQVMLWVIPLLVLPIVILGSFIVNGLMLLFYTLTGHTFIRITKLGAFEFKEIMRIAVIALTPMLLAGALLPHIIPNQGIVYFLISIGYLYHAIKNVTK